MHGVVRRPKTDSEKERERAAQEAARVARYRQAGTALRTARAALLLNQRGSGAGGGDNSDVRDRGGERDQSESERESQNAAGRGAGEADLRAALAASQRVLELNPENYTAWNVRREALQQLEQVLVSSRQNAAAPVAAPSDPETGAQARVVSASAETPAASDSAEWTKVLGDELQLLERAIAIHPKSYWSWLHRRWVCERAHIKPEHWQREIKLCDRLLALDERNFHCWGYRRFVADRLASATGQDAETAVASEFAFTTKKIEDNFSNYSAWHQRSALLLQMHSGSIPAEVLDAEFELVKNAFYTEPNDSAAWFYHEWLAAQALGASASLDRSRAVLEREVTACRELLELEPNSKWPMLTMVRLLRRFEEVDAPKWQAARSEAVGLLSKLVKLDAMRARHYQDMLERYSGDSTTTAA